MPGDWRISSAKSLLGVALLGRKKHAAAEPLPVQGYEEMKLREEKIPGGGTFLQAQTARRLVQLYEATNQPEKARAWREGRGPRQGNRTGQERRGGVDPAAPEIAVRRRAALLAD
jgi:hypothetical protein